MRQLALVLTGLFLASCAARERSEFYADLGARSDGLCWWRDVRWEDRAAILARGTGLPLGRALPDSRNQPVRVTGVLRTAGPLVLFQAEWKGEGLTLLGDVDVADQPLLVAWDAARIGRAGLVGPGAALRVIDAHEGRVLAAPASSHPVFEPAEPHALALSCEDLSLRLPAASRLEGGKVKLAALLPGARLEATDAPGGAVVGHFVTKAEAREVWVLAEQGTAARVAVPDADGAVWVGWVDGAQLAKPLVAPALPEPLVSAPRRAAGGPLRRCPDALELRARVEDKVVPAGRLDVGVAFSVLDSAGEGDDVIIAPEVSWLRLAAGVRMLASRSALRCPEAAPSLSATP